MNKNRIIELTQQAMSMLPVLQLTPNERNCVQLAGVYGILCEIARLVQDEPKGENVDG